MQIITLQEVMQHMMKPCRRSARLVVSVRRLHVPPCWQGACQEMQQTTGRKRSLEALCTLCTGFFLPPRRTLTR